MKCLSVLSAYPTEIQSWHQTTVCHVRKEGKGQCDCRVQEETKIWKSQLNSQHKVDATNTLAMSLLRYRFMTVKWTRRELRDLDVLTRKVLRRYQSHHLNASPERLYLPRSQGGRGLMSCLQTWEREVVSLAAYLATIQDPIMVMVYQHLRM